MRFLSLIWLSLFSCRSDDPIKAATETGVIETVADDEDGNMHLKQADELANIIKDNYPNYNVDKIYFDAYTQSSVPGGERYPDVQKGINDKMFSGTVILNYTGHGGELGWAHERVLNITDIAQWNNILATPITKVNSEEHWCGTR